MSFSSNLFFFRFRPILIHARARNGTRITDPHTPTRELICVGGRVVNAIAHVHSLTHINIRNIINRDCNAACH